MGGGEVETTESFDFGGETASLYSWPPRIPRRLRKRLHRKTPCTTADQIQAKLRRADLRRQEYYEKLSSKARPKPRSPSRSDEEDLAQRLEAKLQAAAQKRSMMLERCRRRLARLEELRQAARSAVEQRWECERQRLESRVDQRIRQAEENRTALLRAHRQRRASLRERSSQTLLRKAVRDSKYKERVRAAILQKDNKRRALLQARADVFRRRARLNHADLLSRKLARCWRRFLKQKTTLELAKAYEARKVNEKSVKSMPFEQVAVLIESPDTLRSVKAVLDRFESRLRVSRALSSSKAGLDNIDHLLRRVATPKRQRRPLRPRQADKSPVMAIAKIPAPLSRYSVRVCLCAYMILSHPEAVFNGRGERETALAKSARELVQEFELLVRIVLEGPVNSSDEEKTKRWTFRTQLEAFDGAWCSYLNCFVVWKDKDAQVLEEDLVRAACQLEFSMMQTCKMSSEGGETSIELTHDMKAVQKQVAEDQRLLREKVLHLSGGVGVKRMESALSETRSKYFLAKENGSPTGSPMPVFLSPNPIGSGPKPSRVVRSLFKEKDGGSQTSGPSSNKVSDDSSLGSSVEKFVAENELVVNEYIHNQRCSVTDCFGSAEEEDQTGIKGIIKETMQKAFWDNVMESMRSENPDYGRVVQLVGEVRDELCKMAPGTWTQMIVEAIDLDILWQVLESGNLDIHYLGKIMKFALDTLQKLSSPDSDEEMKTTHQRLMKELTDICKEDTDGSTNNSSVVAMVKGLRFVLEQIQVLKQEISKARIRLMEELLKGPNGLEYLKNAFANRHGSPSNARSALPLTKQWLSSVSDSMAQEWEEHTNSLSEIASQGSIPSTALRSGGSFAAKPYTNATKTKGDPQPECKGEKIDMMVRLGLLKLVSGVSGLTHEALPETFALNLSRLRSVQAQIQKIIVTSISILICRQTLVSERIAENAEDLEAIVSRSIERLTELLNRDEEAGIEEIVESIGRFSEEESEGQKGKAVMAGTLAKSLRAGDPVFERVKRAVQVAARGVVLGGSGPCGRKLAEAALRQVGAAGASTEKLVEVAGVLAAAATVSVGVHGPWYAQIITDDDNM